MGFKIVIDDPQTYFSSAHFIVGHEKCSRLHGHNFQVRVEVETDELDPQKFVMDFIELKKIVKEVTNPMDHKLLVPTDEKRIKVKAGGGCIEITFPGKRYVIPEEDVIILPIEAITSEMLAYYVHQKLVDPICNRLKDAVVRVRIGETVSSFAEVGW